MMRPVIFNFLELLPEALTSLLASSGTTQVDLTWNDTTPVDYTNLNTFGNTTVVVDMRSAGSLTDSEAAASMIYRAVPPPATGVTLAATPASPRRAGTQVTFTANGSGGSGAYEYLFRIRGPRTNNAWVVVQGYSTSRRFVWRTRQADIGLTTINVRVRSVGSVAGFEAQRSINYRIQ